jgi:hypothetical protein
MKAPIFAALLCLASCTTVPPARAEGPVALGQEAYANGLRVRPIAIVEDSRCPTNVMCVWAGRLVVRTEIRGGSWRETRNLELGQPQQIADGTLTLTAAEPPKVAGVAVDPRSYRFTFDFQGGL